MQLVHILKAVFSGTLLVCSLLWLTIQQLFVPQDFLSQWLQSRSQSTPDLEQLQRDWCRTRNRIVTWREMMEPCLENSIYMMNPRYASNSYLTRVAHVHTRSAGEHTRIRIDTYTKHGTQKSFGGDSFRVSFRGADVVSAAVFDMRNGSYEALALLVTPGEYRVHAYLEYTQCKGFADPPTDWYVKGHCSGKRNNSLVPGSVAASQYEYINEMVSPGLRIVVPEARYNVTDLPNIVTRKKCGFTCDKIWDGFGVWSKENTWKPYDKPSEKKFEGRKLSTLWVYGDSVSYYFQRRLQSTSICNGSVFETCSSTYNWIYPKKLYELRHFCRDMNVDVEKVRWYFRSVLQNIEMDKNSVLIFNLGLHFVKNTSFRKYRQIINMIVDELRRYNGTAVWKSTSAIHQQNKNGHEVMGAFRRFLTNQRVQLFNAYGNAAFCNARAKLLDTHALTASYPQGTKDGVHYHAQVFRPLELMLERYFSQ